MLPFLHSAASRGLTGDALQAALASEGLGYRRTTMLADYRLVKELPAAAEPLRSIRRDRQPDPSRFPAALTRLLREYSYVVRVSGSDARTGQAGSRYVTVSSSALLTLAEVEEDAIDATRIDDPAYPFEADAALLVSAVRAGPSGAFIPAVG